MGDPYVHGVAKMADSGLQLRVPVDLVPANQYSRFSNGRTFIEGRLEGRAGLIHLADFPAPIHSIHRLDQEVFSIPGNRIVGAGTGLYVSQLDTSPDDFRQVLATLSGSPLVIVNFRFDLDEATWAIIIDGATMWKFRDIDPNPSTFIFHSLGNAAPVNASTSQANGSGNLNSSGGPGYDWRYTYLDGDVRTESNPSPIMMDPGSQAIHKPQQFTNPITIGNSPFLNPGSATDTSGSTFASGSANAAPGSTATTSCQWFTINNQVNVVSQTLEVEASLTAESSHGSSSANIAYSIDGGSTWKTLAQVSFNKSLPRQNFVVDVPSAIPNSEVQVRCVITAHALLNDEAFADASVFIYNIEMRAQTAASVNTLVLTNQQAAICVNPSPNPAHTYIRLYRRGGSLPDAWRRVGEFLVADLSQGVCNANALEIDDNVSDATLADSSILELDNDVPVSSVNTTGQPLNFIWGPSNNILLGCGDPNRPESVYFSKSGNADSWPPGNHIEVSAPGIPVIGGCIYNTRTYATSRDRWYELVFGLLGGTTFTPFVTPSARGSIGKFAFCVYDQIYFVSNDGVYRHKGAEEESLVENDIKPLFPTKESPGRDVNGYEAVDMTRPDDIRLEPHNDEIWFRYIGRTSQLAKVLIFDTKKGRWRSAEYPQGTDAYTAPVASASRLANSLTITVNGSDIPPFGFPQYVGQNVTLSGMTDPTMNGTFPLQAVGVIENDFKVANPGPDSGVIVGGGTVTIPFPDKAINVVYSEPNTVSSLLLGDGTHLYQSGGQSDDGTGIPVQIRTGAFDYGQPLNRKEFGDVIFDLDPDGAVVTITPYVNGDLQAQAVLTVDGTVTNGRQQAPLSLGDAFAFNLSFDMQWTKTDTSNPVIYQLDCLHRLEPAGLKHWETRESSLGGVGYQHVRDMYVGIRSNADVTMQMVVDGAYTQSYTIPSTGGARRKVYVQLNSNKGKLYRFIFDSTQEFRLYAGDIEVRSKVWLGLLGYGVQAPFGEETSQ